MGPLPLCVLTESRHGGALAAVPQHQRCEISAGVCISAWKPKVSVCLVTPSPDLKLSQPWPCDPSMWALGVAGLSVSLLFCLTVSSAHHVQVQTDTHLPLLSSGILLDSCFLFSALTTQAAFMISP